MRRHSGPGRPRMMKLDPQAFGGGENVSRFQNHSGGSQRSEAVGEGAAVRTPD